MEYIHIIKYKLRLLLTALMDGLQFPISVSVAFYCVTNLLNIVIEYIPFKLTFQLLAFKHPSSILGAYSLYVFRDKLWNHK